MGKKRPNGYWTLERCKEDASEYCYRVEWSKKSKGAYQAAHGNNWLEECCTHMTNPTPHQLKWTFSACKESAALFISKKEWERGNCSAYHAAHKNNWLDKCCAHMKTPKKISKWTLALCKSSALRFNTISKWQKGDLGAYKHAHKFNWLGECCGHMIREWTYHWTLERCKENALKYQHRKSWSVNSPSAYSSARKRNWLEECCGHMKRSCGVSGPEQDLFSKIKNTFPKAQKIRITTKGFFSDKPLIRAFDIDIYIPELRKGIEFNGTYWHSTEGLARSRLPLGWPIEDIDNYHKLKKDFFTAKGIDYIEIWEKDWIADKQKCITRCLEFLGV